MKRALYVGLVCGWLNCILHILSVAWFADACHMGELFQSIESKAPGQGLSSYCVNGCRASLKIKKEKGLLIWTSVCEILELDGYFLASETWRREGGPKKPTKNTTSWTANKHHFITDGQILYWYRNMEWTQDKTNAPKLLLDLLFTMTTVFWTRFPATWKCLWY